MVWRAPSVVGDRDATIPAAKAYLAKFGYNAELKDSRDPVTGKYSDVYTEEFGRAIGRFAPRRNAEIRRDEAAGHGPYLHDPYVRGDGVYDWTVKMAVGQLQRLQPPPPPPAEWRPIFIFSAPGSGANNTVGPSNYVGERCRNELGLQHIRLEFPVGGYLGLLGGDPGLSYLEVIAAEGADLERKIDAAIAETKRRFGARWTEVIEFWFSGYSQSADGMVKAVWRLFGDGGKFAYLRGRINGLLLFGNPARQPGPTKLGNNPVGWGIARDLIPAWLQALVVDITTNGDMYACTEDGTFQATLYDWFVQAEMSMSFIAFSAGIMLPVVAEYLAIGIPLVGGIFGTAVAGILSAATGLGIPLISGLLNMGVTTDPQLDEFRTRFRNEFGASALLSPNGIAKVFRSLQGLPGIQTHGEYHLPKAEFGGRTGENAAFDWVAGYRGENLRPVAA